MIDEIRKKMQEGIPLTGEEINLYYSDEMGLTQLNPNNDEQTKEAIDKIAGLDIDKAYPDLEVKPVVGQNTAALGTVEITEKEKEQGVYMLEKKKNVDKGSTDVWLLGLMTLVLQPLLMYIVYNFIK